MSESTRDNAASFSLPKKDGGHNELQLSKEQAEKSDKDILTYSAMAEYASAQAGVAGLTDGYAVDAQCSNEVTRPHGDLDVDMFFQSPHDKDQVRRDLATLVQAQGGKWTIIEPENASRSSADLFELHEIDDLKPLPLRRIIAVKVYKKANPHKYMQPALLRDSSGAEHTVLARTVDDLLVRKVTALFPHGISPSDEPQISRRIAANELYDMRRLLADPKFDREASIQRLMNDQLQKSHHKGVPLSDSEARTFAEKQLAVASTLVTEKED